MVEIIVISVMVGIFGFIFYNLFIKKSKIQTPTGCSGGRGTAIYINDGVVGGNKNNDQTQEMQQ